MSNPISSNGANGHHKFTLTITEGALSGRTRALTGTLKMSPVQSGYNWNLQSSASKLTYSITVNGSTSSGQLPASYDGSSTVTIGTCSGSATYNDDGTKTISFSFSVSDTTERSYCPGNASGSSTMSLTPIGANWTAVGSSTVNSITDNGDNTFTVSTTAGSNGTNNAVTGVHIYWRWNNSDVRAESGYYDDARTASASGGQSVSFSNIPFNQTGTLYVKAFTIGAHNNDFNGTVAHNSLAVITAVGQPSLNVSISDGTVTITCTPGSNGTHNAATGVHVELSEDGGTTYSTITLSNNTYSKHYNAYTCIKVRAYTTPTVSGYQSSWNTKGPYDVYPYSVGPQVGVTADPEHSTSPEYMSEIDSAFWVQWTAPSAYVTWHYVTLRRGTITNGVITWNPAPLDTYWCAGDYEILSSATYHHVFYPPTEGWGFDTSVDNVVGATVQWFDASDNPLCPVSNETDNPMSGFTHTYVRVYTGEPLITFYGNGGYVETYRQLEASTTPPQWEAHKYYSYNSVTGEYTETTSQPSNWNTTYTNYFEYIVSEGPVTVLKPAGVPLSMPPAFWSHVPLKTVYDKCPGWPVYRNVESNLALDPDSGEYIEVAPPWIADTYYSYNESTHEYEKTNEPPSDWGTNWSAYYENCPVYKYIAATASSAATWQEQARTSQPSDWASNWGSYYIVDNSVPVPYNYIGYNTSPLGTGTEYPSTSTYTGSQPLTLYAKYQIKTYTITFYDGYNANPYYTIQGVTHGSNISDSQLPSPPNRGDKYTFNGWSGGGYNWTTGLSPEPQRMIISDVDVYAQWGSAPIWIFNNGWKPYLPQE